MTQHQRLASILESLAESGSITIDAIVDRFGVSLATARRDLNTLADQRLATRTHGGAISAGSAYDLPLNYKIAKNAKAKAAIAQAAVRLIEPGNSVGLTGGTTANELAREIGKNGRLQAEPAVTVVTNALNVAIEMAIRPNVDLIVTGGKPRAQSFELVGELVERTLSTVVLDWAFVGVNGVSAQHGATTVNDLEARVNRLLGVAAKRVVIIADGSKLGHSHFAKTHALSEIDYLITDVQPDAELAAALAEHGVRVIVAPADD